jgi:hypothetical protein
MRQNWRSSLYMEFAEVLQIGAFVSTLIVASSRRDIFLGRSIKIYYFAPDLAICPVVLLWPLCRSASKQPGSVSGCVLHDSTIAGSYIHGHANLSYSKFIFIVVHSKQFYLTDVSGVFSAAFLKTRFFVYSSCKIYAVTNILQGM